MVQRRRLPAKKQGEEENTADDGDAASGAADTSVDQPRGGGEGASATPSSLSREEQARLRRKLQAKYH